ncbi:MAG: hypothetical protein QOE16_765 [Microbacteriaceae bacterium]|jgi:hypothetical protein|nr:hypothetical protein [Microbacteriaceae bacterium]
MAVGPQESVLAPHFSRGLAVLVVAICVFTEVSLIMYGHPEPLLRATPALAFVAVGMYALFWAPLLRINSTEVEVVNPLRTHRIAWSAIRDITTRWTLTLVTDSGSYPAWAVSAPSPWASIGRLNRDALGRPSLSAERARLGAAPGLAPIVLQQWESYRDSGSVGTDGVSTSWNVGRIALLASLAVVTILALAWP